MCSCPAERFPVGPGCLPRPHRSSGRGEDILMAGVRSCALRPGGAQFGPPGCQLLKPQVPELAAVGWLPPPSDGRHGHPLGPVQGPGLLVGQARVPDRAGQLQVDPALRLPIGHQGGPFTKPPLLQESRLTGGGSPNLMVLVEWKVPVERFMGAANSFH